MANAIKAFFPDAFRTIWATIDPAWSTARIAVFPATFVPPPKVDGKRVPWLAIHVREVPGSRKAINGLDAAAYNLTVDIFAPLPETEATAIELISQRVKRAFGLIEWPDGAMPLGPPLGEDIDPLTEDRHQKARVRMALEVLELPLSEAL